MVETVKIMKFMIAEETPTHPGARSSLGDLTPTTSAGATASGSQVGLFFY